MRARAILLISAIFAAAAAASAFVVSQLPREGDVSPPAPSPVAAAPAETSPEAPGATGPRGTIEVRVTAGGEPHGGAEVRLYLAPGAGEPWRRAGRGRTGLDGVARLDAGPGAYLVAVRAPGLAPGRTEVARAEEETVRADVALEPPSALRGRAVATGGAPVAGARVRAVPLFSQWLGRETASAPPEETAVAATDAAGGFGLVGLTPGWWAVALEAPGFHPVLLPRVAVPAGALEVALERLGAVEGTVLLANGQPAAGALVRAASADHAAAERSGPDGRFRLAAPAGSYVVQASLGDRAGAAAAPVTVASGAIARRVEVRLGSAAWIDAQLRRTNRAPAVGAEVAVLLHGTQEIVARAVAGADGRCAVAGLAPGAYDLQLRAPAASPVRVAGVKLAAGGRFPLRAVLPGMGAVEGTVRDAAGRPLAAVRVRAVQRGDGLGAGAPVDGRTDFEGRFRLEPLEVGRVEVGARAEGALIGSSRAVRVAEGRASRVELTIPETGFLAGRVGGSGRAAPAGTTVVAVALDAGPGSLQVARAAADARGNYRLALPAGEYRVHAAPGDAARTDVRVAPAFTRVEARSTSRLDLALPPGGERGVEIVVLEPGGAPSPGALVTFGRPDGDRIGLATSAGENGRVAIGREMGVAGQTVTVRARNGDRSGAQTLTLPASGTVEVRLAPAPAR